MFLFLIVVEVFHVDGLASARLLLGIFFRPAPNMPTLVPEHVGSPHVCGIQDLGSGGIRLYGSALRASGFTMSGPVGSLWAALGGLVR